MSSEIKFLYLTDLVLVKGIFQSQFCSYLYHFVNVKRYFALNPATDNEKRKYCFALFERKFTYFLTLFLKQP